MANRLKSTKSPYLLQHADNPVDWHPWDEKAFIKAEKKDKPIFLSIGYAACHWCHVMARESFEDLDTARFLNEHFVPVKVDREEQPDVDIFYMNVCQKLTGGGGWPLSVFLTPERKPFFAGTYFPKRTIGNVPAFTSVLQEIERLWKTNRKRLVTASEQIMQEMEAELRPLSHSGAAGAEGLASSVFEHLKLAFDSENGGFGTAPKFPTASFLDLLLALFEKEGSRQALDMACFTLEKMRLGGIWDHLAGGFHRYSVDERWLVPHFEKMLYDQALLLSAYTRAFELSENDLFLETARSIAGFVMSDLTSSEGGFYSALDADSEGKEGAYYLWSMDELGKVLGEEALPLFRKIFSVEEGGNFQEGKNVIALRDNYDVLAKDLGKTRGEIENFVKRSCGRLLLSRKKRMAPGRDDKIITSWNALMICGLMDLYRVTKEPDLVEAAEKCLGLLLEKLFSQKGLKRRLAAGEAKHRACLEDYACLLMAASNIYFEEKDEHIHQSCMELARQIRTRFYDSGLGMLLYSPLGEKDIPARVKPPPDGPLPSPLSVLLKALLSFKQAEKSEEIRELLEIVKRQGEAEALRNPLGNCHYIACLLRQGGRQG